MAVAFNSGINDTPRVVNAMNSQATKLRQHSSRRRFLKQTVAASAASLVPYHFVATQAFGQSKSKNEQLRFALIGVGGNGTRTAPGGKRFAEPVAHLFLQYLH